MPNRIIREGIITSDRVEQLDPAAEVFYRRLLNKVDDHGLYDARPSILRANLYPLRIDRVREADISRWMAACQKAGLIVFYEAGGKPYLKVLNTNWQVRSEPKYPQPPDSSCAQLLATEHLDVVVDVVGDDKATPLSGRPDPLNGSRSKAMEVLQFLNVKTGRNYQAVDANLKLIVARLKEGATVDDCRAVVAKKFRDWNGDDKMQDYLRPATLFNATKFAQYRGELADGNP
jgi:uncharacterized phage protein (TIGR02220 family)